MKKFIGFCFFLLCLYCFSFAQVRLPRLIRDSMVLQRDQPLSIWGWASPGEKVSVRFQQKRVSATTAKDGKWMLTLPAMKAGGPYEMEIKGSNTILLKEVLVGDVWLCSGQSNMEHQLSQHHVRYAAEIATTNNPFIRQFKVPNTTNLQGPQQDLPGGFWKPAMRPFINDFSTVAYFMAAKLYDQYRVPIGIINTSWGGTPIEAWISEAGYAPLVARNDTSFARLILKALQQNKDSAYVNDIARKALAAAPKPISTPDRGLTESWFLPSYVPKGWRTLSIPGYWEDQGIRDLDGVVWYRREIDVPASMVNVPAKVFLGRIVDADVLYINGKQVGTNAYLYPERRYYLPEGTLKAGKNVFVIRVTNNANKGGFVPDKPYQLIAGTDTIQLTGYWQYKVGLVFPPRIGPAPPAALALHYQPAALFNAMVAPLVPYTLKGFAWYQGETNAGRPAQYAQLQPAMIADWRHHWNKPSLPFLFVQLPGYMDMNYLPSESSWAAFREAQRQSLAVPNTAMAITMDLGEWNDVHPDRKKEVGERLALGARRMAYGDTSLVYSGPLFQSARVEGNKIIVSFSHTGSGLVAIDGEELGEFALAGADKKFVWAKARIVGDQVEVWCDAIAQPVFVRYAWADNPVNPNLFNKEGLPASPFRTDW